MPVSHELKTIFVHIPRCAGESIEKHLGIYGFGMSHNVQQRMLWGVYREDVLQHLSISRIRSIPSLEPVIDSYFKFAFVRNPWDRAVSEYHWHIRHAGPMSFSDWVRDLEHRVQRQLSGDPIPPFEVGHNLPMHSFLYSPSATLLVDFVGRFENLDADFQTVCKRIGLHHYELKHSQPNASLNRRPYRVYYDAQSRREVHRVYSQDVDYFGYRF